jgi:hypothetical protein
MRGTGQTGSGGQTARPKEAGEAACTSRSLAEWIRMSDTYPSVRPPPSLLQVPLTEPASHRRFTGRGCSLVYPLALFSSAEECWS